jgi:hypothetical protein
LLEKSRDLVSRFFLFAPIVSSPPFQSAGVRCGVVISQTPLDGKKDYRDFSKQYPYIFDRRKWTSEHLHTLYAENCLLYLSLNVYRDILWSLIGAKKSGNLRNSIFRNERGVGK